MSNYLVHYGIPGQKWGNRRFQNEDGSLTPAGEQRYYDSTVTRGTTATPTNRPNSRVKTVGSGSVTATAGKTGYSDTENPVSGSSNPAWQAQMALKLKGQNGIQSVYFKPNDRNTYVIGPDGKEHQWDYVNNKIKDSTSSTATANKPNYGTETPYENTMNQYIPKYEVKQKIANVASNIGTGIKNVANKADKALGSVVNVGNQIRADNEYNKAKDSHLEADKAEIMARESQKEADHYKELAKNATGAAKDKFNQAKTKSEGDRDKSLFVKSMLNKQRNEQLESAGKYQEKANRTLTETIGDSVEKAKSKVSSLLSKLGKLKF